MLQGVLIDEAIEVLFQRAGDFGGATGARAIHQALRALVGKAMDPLAQGGIGKWSASETVCRRCPLTTSRTAWARRKTRASLVCFKKVSKVGRASSGKCSLRVRIWGSPAINYYKNIQILRHTMCLPSGLDHGIGHFMLFEVDSEARAPAPPIPKSPQTSSAASDRKSAPLPSSRQAG